MFAPATALEAGIMLLCLKRILHALRPPLPAHFLSVEAFKDLCTDSAQYVFWNVQ